METHLTNKLELDIQGLFLLFHPENHGIIIYCSHFYFKNFKSLPRVGSLICVLVLIIDNMHSSIGHLYKVVLWMKPPPDAVWPPTLHTVIVDKPLIRFLFLLSHLYFSGMWFGVASKTHTKKIHV